jgi:hypothetical protein
MHRAPAVLAVLIMAVWGSGCGDSSSSDNPTPTPPTPTPIVNLYFAPSSSDTIVGYRLDESSGALTSIPDASRPGQYVVTSTSGSFLYAVDTTAHVLAYAIDPATGGLSPIPNSASPRVQGFHLLADPRGEFLYMLDACRNGNPNPCSDLLRVFRVDKDTGAITGEAPGSPFPVGFVADNLLVHPSGDFVYTPGLVVGGSIPRGIWGFRVDRSAGTLTPIPGSPLTGIHAAQSGQSDVGVFHPTLPFLYIDEYEGAIRTLRIDPQTGALTSVARLELPATVTGMDMDPSGRYVYASAWKEAVHLLSVDANTGALRFAGTPTRPHAGYSFDGIYAHPSGRILFASEAEEGVYPNPSTRLHVLSIDAKNSTLTDIAGSPLTVIGGTAAAIGEPPRVRSLANSRWTLVVPPSSGKLHQLNVSPDYTSVSVLDLMNVPTLSYAVAYVRGSAGH